MTQKQVELRKEYLKVLKNTAKRNIAKQAKDRVKKNLLLCYERAKSPDCKQRNNTPLSYSVIADNAEFVYFLAYRFDEYSKGYQCSTCFCTLCPASATLSDKERFIWLEKHSTYWEISLKQFYKNLQSLSDDNLKCVNCKKPLTILRPYHSAHLNFE